MRAYVLHEFGEAPRLTDLPVPVPADDEVMVRVRASSVNPVDAMIGAGGFRQRMEHRLPAVLGRDIAGTVVAAGPAVTRFQKGDEVFGFVKRPYIGGGTFAEYVAVPQDRHLVARPAALPVAAAGAIGLAAVTALQCLDALDLQPGAFVLVSGATGGVGAFLLQLARLRKLNVVATARPGAEQWHVRALGAARSVDWSGADVAAEVLAARPAGVDGLIDLVSPDTGRFTALADAVLAPDGRAVSTLSAAPAGVPGRGNVHSEGDPELLGRVADLAVSLRVPLVATYPLEGIEDAFTALRQAPLGKIGLTVGG